MMIKLHSPRSTKVDPRNFCSRSCGHPKTIFSPVILEDPGEDATINQIHHALKQKLILSVVEEESSNDEQGEEEEDEAVGGRFPALGARGARDPILNLRGLGFMDDDDGDGEEEESEPDPFVFPSTETKDRACHAETRPRPIGSVN